MDGLQGLAAHTGAGWRPARSGRVKAWPAASWPSGSAIRRPATLNAITRADIVAHFGTVGETGPAGARITATALRSLFRFLFATGRIERNLVPCVPSVPAPRSPAPTRHLSREEVERVLTAAKGDSAVAPPRPCDASGDGPARPARPGGHRHPARRHRLGCRRDPGPRQAAGGRRPCRFPSTWARPSWTGSATGERDDRGISSSVSGAPFPGFTSAAPVRKALRKAHAASGVAPPGGKVRCHVFRHSLGMALLQDGMPLADIGNMLRHDSARTTTVYARHDIEALRPLARPWPVPAARRGGRIMTSLSTLLSEYLDHRRPLRRRHGVGRQGPQAVRRLCRRRGRRTGHDGPVPALEGRVRIGRPEHVGHPARRRAQLCNLAARH